MSLADEVRTVRERVAARLTELEPLVHEYDELVRLADELGLDVPQRTRSQPSGRSSPNATRERASATPPSDEKGARTAGRGSRAAGSGRRAKPTRPRRRRATEEPTTVADLDARVIEALRASPGATIADLATTLGVPPTSLYRPVRELTTSGPVVKRGRGLFVED
jgi:Winged helix-turn-helix DNA-binding